MAYANRPPGSKQTSLSEAERQRIAEVLEEKGATAPCPRCGKRNFAVLEGYFLHSLNTLGGTFNLGGPSIPVAVIACSNCGFLSEHALGALGLLPREESK